MIKLIGFNIVAFAICSLIILLMYDGTLKEKIIGMIGEALFMALLSFGLFLMSGNG